MIKLSLDKFDFLCAVEGFARGSHLRQHVWEQIVYKSIPQMSKEDINFCCTSCVEICGIVISMR